MPEYLVAILVDSPKHQPGQANLKPEDVPERSDEAISLSVPLNLVF
ncbi:MAG: hypothetical protein OXC26_04955 [Albidovulum sp.]|nr:hypothetical protein [Albidovulum sp.]